MNKGIHIIHHQAIECHAQCERCIWAVEMGETDGVNSEEDVRQASIQHFHDTGHHIDIYRGNKITVQEDLSPDHE